MGSEAQCCRKPIYNLWDETARIFREFEHNLWNCAGNRAAAVNDHRGTGHVAFLAAEIAL